MDRLKVCRACLCSKTETELVDWSLPSQYCDVTFAQCFYECTHLSIPNDDEPGVTDASYLCLDCINELEFHYHFLLKCRESDEAIRALAKPAIVEKQSDVQIPTEQEQEEEEQVVSEFEEEILFTQELPPAHDINDAANPKIHPCNLCNRRFNRPVLLREHLAVHAGTRNFPCARCDKKFFSKSALNQHALVHDRQRQLQCDQCGKTCRTKRDLNVHQRLHASKRDFMCSVCGKGYVRNVDLKVHMERTHSGQTYKCKLCAKEFIQKISYTNHMLTHEGHYYQCELCDQYYTSRDSYFDHRLTHGQQPFKCGLCEKEFVRMNRLCQHIRTGHRIQDHTEIEKHIVRNPKVTRQSVSPKEVWLC